jgi:hypothetical protein
VGRELDPVVPHHVLQGVIATQCRQASFPREVLDLTALNIVQTETLEGDILDKDWVEVPVYLILQEGSFEILEREVVKLKNLEISLEEPRIFVGTELLPEDFAKNPSEWFEDHSRYVESQEVDEFVDGCRSCYVVPSHKIEHLDEFIGAEAIVVEVLVEFINDFEVIFLEELQSGELHWWQVEFMLHDVNELVYQILMAFELFLLLVLDSLVLGGIE